jgi:phosphopantothenoylcysteine decarboxylase/phosphopantothenate--cysteine ligase
MKASLQGKRILLGVTGSISAYKAPILVREFVKNGAEVRVVMTESAEEFVTSLALQNTSKNTVVTNMFDDSIQERGSWHIHLAQWCDCMVIAPCSATTLARIANGFADNALTALVLALSDKPCYIFPAMDTDMWLHPATQKNCESVRSFGYHVIEPAHGELASGLVG